MTTHPPVYKPYIINHLHVRLIRAFHAHNYHRYALLLILSDIYAYTVLPMEEFAVTRRLFVVRQDTFHTWYRGYDIPAALECIAEFTGGDFGRSAKLKRSQPVQSRAFLAFTGTGWRGHLFRFTTNICCVNNSILSE